MREADAIAPASIGSGMRSAGHGRVSTITGSPSAAQSPTTRATIS